MNLYKKITITLIASLSIAIGYSQASVASTDNKIYALDPSKKTRVNYRAEKVDYSIWKSLLSKNAMANGKVNYTGFREDLPKLNKFLRELSNAKISSSWTKKDKLAFWINVYNAFTIKLILNNYPISSIKEINDPWKNKFFTIQGKLMSLAEVEHGVLRKQFNDPRIHFAINCASRSCPRLIQIPYTSENLDKLLERQTKEFINDEFYNTITDYTVNVSHIFDWYRKDFKATHGSVINFISQYCNVPIGKQKNKGYKPYDWSLNDQKN